MDEQPKAPTAHDRYRELEKYRQPYMDRAKECADYTIAALFPEDRINSTVRPRDPYQSVGSMGVNNLASKLTLTLLPPNEPFFRHSLTEDMRETIRESQGDNADAVLEEFDNALSSVDRKVLREIETLGMRPSCYEAIRHLLVGGNAAIDMRPGVTPRMVPLSRYVVRRDGNGKVLEFLMVEFVHRDSLPASVRDAPPAHTDKSFDKDRVHLYTWVKMKDPQAKNKRWTASQWVEDKMIPNTEKEYTFLPVLVLRMARIDGEDYGRSYCDELIGDLRFCEQLSFATQATALLAAKQVFFLKPGAIAKQGDITKAEPGDVIAGEEGDLVPAYDINYNNAAVSQQILDGVVTRLNKAFLDTTSIQRNGERVTAEEIRRLAGELEQALGGFYTTLSLDFQLALVQAVVARMQLEDELPNLKGTNGKPLVEPVIVTGIDALGRSNDLGRLNQMIGIAAQAFPAEFSTIVDPSVAVRRIAANLGVDPKGLIRTQEQVDQINAARQQAALAQQVAGPVATAATRQQAEAAQGA